MYVNIFCILQEIVSTDLLHISSFRIAIFFLNRAFSLVRDTKVYVNIFRILQVIVSTDLLHISSSK